MAENGIDRLPVSATSRLRPEFLSHPLGTLKGERGGGHMARIQDDREHEQPVERPLERKGIDVIEPERPAALTELPTPPPPKKRRD
jgi:hypothetical protein